MALSRNTKSSQFSPGLFYYHRTAPCEKLQIFSIWRRRFIDFFLFRDSPNMKRGFILSDCCIALAALSLSLSHLIPVLIQLKASTLDIKEIAANTRSLRAIINNEDLISEFHECESYTESLFYCKSTIDHMEISWFISRD